MVLPTPTTNVEPPQQKVGGNCVFLFLNLKEKIFFLNEMGGLKL